MKKYNTTTLICTNTMSCDALLEVTSMWFDIHKHGDCPVCFSELAVISAEQSSTKEEKVDFTEVSEKIQESYLQEMELKYGNEITELKNKISTLEYTKEHLNKSVNKYFTQEQMLRSYLIENHDELQEHAVEIAEIFGFTLTKEATYNLTVLVQVNVEVPVEETDNIEDFISSNLSISSFDSGVDVCDWSIDSCDEE